jgi:hypothetical protein
MFWIASAVPRLGFRAARGARQKDRHAGVKNLVSLRIEARPSCASDARSTRICLRNPAFEN